jgi:hypothetical protein
LLEAVRTKALGLMHKQLCKDSSMCRPGLPDYVVTMRKPGENQNLIAHENGMVTYAGGQMLLKKAFILMRFGANMQALFGLISDRETR